MSSATDAQTGVRGPLLTDTVSILVQVTSKVSWTMRGTAPILPLVTARS